MENKVKSKCGKEFKRSELLRKYTAKLLFRWNDKKFKDKYLKKLEKNWNQQKGKDKMIWGNNGSSRAGTLKRG